MQDGAAHPSLAVCGYSEAGMILCGKQRPDVVAMISISGQREFRVEAQVPHRLDLCFDDVEVAPAGDDDVGPLRVHARRRWAEQNGLIEVPPSAEDAAAIIAFAESIKALTGVVLCHCGAGMSRAPAAALICLAVWNRPGNEAACVDELRRLRPSAVPHRGLVRFADELLGRGGALIDALIRGADN